MGWIIVLLILVIAVLAILFLNRFYVKATRETALVRTGLGGQRVILDGGALGLPIVHRIAEVNMKTMRLEVERWPLLPRGLWAMLWALPKRLGRFRMLPTAWLCHKETK